MTEDNIERTPFDPTSFKGVPFAVAAPIAPVIEIKAKKPRRRKCKKCTLSFFPDEGHNYENCVVEEEKPAKNTNQAPQAQAATPAEIVEKVPMTKTEASLHLYNLQMTVFAATEQIAKSAGYNELNGLHTTMEPIREQYLRTFEGLYEEYGENLDVVLSPTICWGLLTAQSVVNTVMYNKKKTNHYEIRKTVSLSMFNPNIRKLYLFSSIVFLYFSLISFLSKPHTSLQQSKNAASITVLIRTPAFRRI
jgi:hypothetical protein